MNQSEHYEPAPGGAFVGLAAVAMIGLLIVNRSDADWTPTATVVLLAAFVIGVLGGIIRGRFGNRGS